MKFKRWLSDSIVRIKKSWRRPRGIHSKVRLRKKGKIKMPSIGMRTPKEIRGLHPSGFREVLVERPEELLSVDAKKEAVRIAKKVGRKKREEIKKKAEELGIKVLNP